MLYCISFLFILFLILCLIKHIKKKIKASKQFDKEFLQSLNNGYIKADCKYNRQKQIRDKLLEELQKGGSHDPTRINR